MTSQIVVIRRLKRHNRVLLSTARPALSLAKLQLDESKPENSGTTGRYRLADCHRDR